MSIKEKPLIDAISKPDALPALFFANPIVTGLFTVLMSAVFGAVFALFWSLHGTAYESYNMMRIGAYCALGLTGLILFGIFISAFREPDEKWYRLQFVLGGVIGIAAFVTADLLSTESLGNTLIEKGYLICTSKGPDCY